MAHTLTKACDSLIELLVYLLIIFTPLFYGSVQSLPLTILESAVFLILFIWVIKIIFTQEAAPVRLNFWLPISLFILLTSLQLIPLARPALAILSPRQAFLINKFISQQSMAQAGFSLSIYRNQTAGKLIELLSYVSLFFVLTNLLNSRKRFRRIILLIIFTGFLVTLIELMNAFKYPFINRNHFAGYLEMAIPLTIGYLLTDLIKPKKVIFYSMGVIMLAGLFLSLSRAGILCFLGAMIFILFALRMKKSLKKMANLVYLLISISTLVIVAMGIEPILERFAISFGQEIIGDRARWVIWKDTLRIAADFPFFGSGLGTFRNIYPMYKTLPLQVTVSYAHNDFLQLASETGLAGLAIAAWFLALFFRKVFSGWLKRHDPFARGVVLGGMAGILALSLHSFFDFNLQIPSNAFLFTIIMALAYKCAFSRFDEDEAS